MTLEQIKQQLVNLTVQRSSLKDQIDQIERAMQQLSFAAQVLEAQPKADEPQAEVEEVPVD